MNTQATLDQLFSMHLSGMARQYESILQLPVHQHPDAHSLVASLADAEEQYRSHAKIQLYLRLSMKITAHTDPPVTVQTDPGLTVDTDPPVTVQTDPPF